MTGLGLRVLEHAQRKREHGTDYRLENQRGHFETSFESL